MGCFFFCRGVLTTTSLLAKDSCFSACHYCEAKRKVASESQTKLEKESAIKSGRLYGFTHLNSGQQLATDYGGPVHVNTVALEKLGS